MLLAGEYEDGVDNEVDTATAEFLKMFMDGDGQVCVCVHVRVLCKGMSLRCTRWTVSK